MSTVIVFLDCGDATFQKQFALDDVPRLGETLKVDGIDERLPVEFIAHRLASKVVELHTATELTGLGERLTEQGWKSAECA